MAKEFKKLYETTINKEVMVDKSEEQTNDKGEKITVTKKVKEKQPVKLVIINPTRQLRETAEVHYAGLISDLINKGVHTRYMLRKKILDGVGGVLSNEENKEFLNTLQQLQDIEIEYQKLILIDDKDKTKEEKERLKTIQEEYVKIQDTLIQLEQTQQNLFSTCAENIASSRMVSFWLLHLTYIQEKQDKEPRPFFEGETLDEKFVSYDKLEDENSSFNESVVTQASLAVTIWRQGLGDDQKSIEEFIDKLNKEAEQPVSNETNK